ncbi:thioredoxin, mitochondrial-like [Planoprotostelium fungivorum]|uniref:Thioredoxin, mitochondrial-like n=1 Tax=Planoprotostelium fungivorum TaxID=1890364 RepID=A0A2P6NIG9_9EUKA|nr:thioredoxin, mitochondrial-like [Planoprotostelium fungivorum]
MLRHSVRDAIKTSQFKSCKANNVATKTLQPSLNLNLTRLNARQTNFSRRYTTTGETAATKASPTQQEGVFKVDETNWVEIVEHAKTPILVDFKAEWCGPCKVLGPRLQKLVAERQGSIQLAVVDIDENPRLTDKYNVTAVPTVHAFHHGAVVDSFMGALNEDALKEFVDKIQNHGNKQA